MPDKTSTEGARPKRPSSKAAGEALAGRMAALAAPAATTPTRTRTREAAADKPARRAAARQPRVPMPAEQPRPPAVYSARISHTTTPQQLAALEAIRTEAKTQGSGAVAVTALIRAAVELCLTDQKLKTRWIKLARTEWR